MRALGAFWLCVVFACRRVALSRADAVATMSGDALPATDAGSTAAAAALAVAAAAAAAAAAATNTRSELNASCADYMIGRCARGHLCPYGHTVLQPIALAAAFAAAVDPHMSAFGMSGFVCGGRACLGVPRVCASPNRAHCEADAKRIFVWSRPSRVCLGVPGVTHYVRPSNRRSQHVVRDAGRSGVP